MSEHLNLMHYHEAIDRTACVQEIIQNMLVDHPVFEGKKHPAWKEKVERAQQLLGEVYQEVSSYEPFEDEE